MWHHIQKYNLNQRGADRVNDVSVTKYQKYSSIVLPKYVNILADIIKSYDVHLYNIAPYNKYIVLQSTYAKWPYCKLVANKMFQIPVQNDQSHRVPNITTLKYLNRYVLSKQ